MSNGISTINVEDFNAGVFFSMTIRKWGARARVRDAAKLAEYLALLAKADDQTVAAIEGSQIGSKVTAKSAAKTTVQLLRSEPYDKLVTFLNETKAKLCGPFGKANPSRIKEGLFVVSKQLIQEFEDQLNAAQDKLSLEYIPALTADYEAAKERARTLPVDKGGLGPLYNPQDYPPVQEVEKLFSLEWQWLALGVPEDLPAALRAEANEKFQRQMQEAADEVKTALRASLAGFVSHLVERLTVNPGDKPKIFRDTVIGNIQQFIEVFNARNIMGDTELAALVDKARTLIQDVSPDKLREHADVRENTREGFEQIKAQLDLMISEQKGRVFDLSDEK